MRTIFNTVGLLFVLFWSSSILAQSEADRYIPKVLPPSPNAASLMKFGDIPVSYYTGSAGVSVPIYTVQSGDITVPITLSYNTTGIRLSEEASWVGLGWALSAGGMISRTIMGRDDWDAGYFTTAVPEINTTPTAHPAPSITSIQLNPYMYDFWCDYLVYTTGGNLNFSQPLINPNAYDMEADIYSYNFPGFSGKFIIGRDGVPVIQNQDNIKIQYTANAASFAITDDKGFRFLFSSKEYAQRDGSSPISSWYLSQIVSPTGRTVQFNYNSQGPTTISAGSFSDISRQACSVNTGTTSTATAATYYQNIYLESIEFTNGRVQFYFDNSRVDQTNAKKLNKVSVFRKLVSNDSTEIFSYNFYYSYFNNSYVGVPATEFKRLKLDSVKQSSGASFLPPYKFVYYDDTYEATSLTGKTSKSIDHWGYYNAVANSFLYPKFYGYFNPPTGTAPGQPLPSWWDLTDGADRNPKLVKPQLFSLNTIVYPTGGKSVFELEGNDYDEQKSFLQGQTDYEEINYFDTSVTYTISTRGTVNNTVDLTNKYGPKVWVNMAFRCSNSTVANTLHNTSGQIYTSVFSNTVDINSNSLILSGSTWATGEVAYSVSSGTTYNLATFISPSISTTDFQDITVTIRWKQLRRATYGVILGGGLRIKSITDYNESGIAVKKRKYDYHYFEDRDGNGINEEYSYGKLISRPSYTRFELLRGTDGQGWNTGCVSLTRFGSSIIGTTGITSGNAIGYDQVTEYVVDPTNESNTLGKTVYQYHNLPDTIINFNRLRLPGINNIGSSKNGQLKAKIDYRLSGGSYIKVAEQFNYYTSYNRKLVYSMKLDNVNPPGAKDFSSCVGGVGNPGVETEFFGFIYPSVQSEKILLDSTRQISYESSGVTNSISTITRNTYTPLSTYKQLSKTETYNSKNELIRTEISYPYDYSGVIYDTMMARNMVSTVIGQKIYNNNVLMSQVKTQFKLWQSNTLVLPDTISTATLSNGLESVVKFDSYDLVGNPIQFTPRTGTGVVVIWDYNNVYPIAKITNASLSQVAYTSFETSNTGYWTITDTMRNKEGLTGDQSFVLKATNNIVYTNSTTNLDFYVSYWSKNGQATLSGATSLAVKAGLTKNGWTYYEHKIRTTGGSITLSSSNANVIDELRLYPVTAQMETLTYLPLVGTTSQCSVNNIVSYYNYDEFSRLRLIRDIDGNIIKTFEYNYKK